MRALILAGVLAATAGTAASAATLADIRYRGTFDSFDYSGFFTANDDDADGRLTLDEVNTFKVRFRGDPFLFGSAGRVPKQTSSRAVVFDVDIATGRGAVEAELRGTVFRCLSDDGIFPL